MELARFGETSDEDVEGRKGHLICEREKQTVRVGEVIIYESLLSMEEREMDHF